jgi:hypothetical protein
MSPQLAHKIEQLHRTMQQFTWGSVSCKPGCMACCFSWVTVGLAEAEYIWSVLELVQRERVLDTGRQRLAELVHHRKQSDWPTTHFLRRQACPLLTEGGLCGVYQARPLACRGVLTDLDSQYCQPGAVPGLRGEEKKHYQQQLDPRRHGPEHYLSRPWNLSQQLAEEVWALEQQQRGFTVIGEMAGLMTLLQEQEFVAALASRSQTRRYLNGRGLLGGAWGYWVG